MVPFSSHPLACLYPQRCKLQHQGSKCLAVKHTLQIRYLK